jgi:hypothetical protein
LIVVDTNVLVYAVGAEHDLRASARRLMRAVAAGTVAATTTAEVIQGFAHAFARRRGRTLAVVQASRYVEGLSPLLRPRREDLEAGLSLFERHPRLHAFDCVLAATAVSRDPRAFVSADRGFADVDGLPFVELGSPELDRLLA